MISPKYNRTLHLPWSMGASNDDKIAQQVNTLINIPIVISEKIDGSNTSLEAGGCYARTHAGPPAHPSFDGLKALHSQVRFKIPEHYQLFGEWVYAKHSIAYSQLPGYFLLFNIREVREESIWLSWQEVELWAEELSVPTVPVLFQGKVSSVQELEELTLSFMNQPSAVGGEREGVVVRDANQFLDSEFSNCVMKLVRANHVQTSDHWKHQNIIKNLLSGT